MSLARYAKCRDKNEPLLVGMLEMLGATVDKIDRPVDLIVAYLGVTVLVEVKGPKGKLTDAQSEWLTNWPGGLRCVLRTTDDCAALIDDIKETRKDKTT